ncbi:MAG: STAS domain-containing protein [Candidatus Omnitrophota bacterium]
MEIRKRFANNIAILYMTGAIDINSALLIEETGRLAKEGIEKILIDFTNIDIVDYNGLSILAIAYKNVANQKGTLKFCNVQKQIVELFKTARLDKVFDMYGDEKSALKSFELTSKVDKINLRRRFKRIDISMPVRFKIGVSSKEKMMTGKVLNISGLGLFIYSRNTFPISTELYLEIGLSSAKTPLVLTGAVIWLADKQLQPHSYPGMGIEFENLEKSTQINIIEHIDKNVIYRSRT